MSLQAAEILKLLNTLDEHEKIEAKRGSDVGASILETICAFANEPGLGGGSILLGVVRDEFSLFPSYSVEGLSTPDEICADIATQCREMFSSPVRVELSSSRLDGKTVVVVTVHEAQPQDKPIFLRRVGLPKGAYRRIGSIDQRCTDDDVALLYQGRDLAPFDAGIVSDATIEDISRDAIADYRRSRTEANAEAEELQWTDDELLQAIGAVRRAPNSNHWQPTVAGLLLFGTRIALRRCFPTVRVDYIRVPGRDWIPDPETRFESIEMRDPLFTLIRRAQAAILDDLPRAFGLAEGELQRTDTPLIPQRVIREGLVNALMHRSYRSTSPIQIIRYANRVEIRNPGFSLKSPEHLGEPGSQPRNPKIAAVLHETRFAETKGSGIRVMREMMERAGLTPPLFESDRSHDHFVARYFFHHFLGESDVEWLAAFKDLMLTDEEARALVVVRESGVIDNATYRSLNGVDALAASQVLRRLRDAELLIQRNRGSATQYVPGPRMLAREKEMSVDSGGVPGRQSRELDSLSRELGGLSREPEALSRELDALSRESISAENEQKSKLLSPIPGDLAARLGSLGQRSKPDLVKGVIVDLLMLRPWRTDELATVLGRNAEYVRQQYLQPLVQEGRIAMTLPDEPNSPNQAYRLAKA